ncbi:MAG: sulfatase-like hydrolase/transferase [Deltaproteobacteria bacterium]|nr:sulfatase-like hydrolase/transferase [Deltaproteobacteria bacterium]
MLKSNSHKQSLRLINAAGLGFGLGALYFIADLIGTSLAVGSLADLTASGILLILIAGIFACTIGAVISTFIWLIFKLLKQTTLPKISPKLAIVALSLCFLVIAIGGFWARIGRRPLKLDSPSVAPYPNARNVLLVAVDALRADTFYGDNFTFPFNPKIASWSQNAAIFTDAESTASWTIPSVATILTGILPERHYASRGYLADWTPTLAERFRAAGYNTVAFVDNALLERRNGYTAGFANYFQKSAFRFAFSLPSFRLLPKVISQKLRNRLRVFEFGAPRLTDKAIEVIRAPNDRPLFLFMHYMDPHDPYYKNTEFSPDPDNSEPADASIMAEKIRANPQEKPSVAQLKFMHHRYNGEVQSLDEPLWRLISAFEQRFGDDAIIIITADHGEEFLDHGGLLHGMNLNRELVHVPLLIKSKDTTDFAPKLLRINAPVSLVDLAPTLLDLAGVPKDLGSNGFSMDGVSLLPYLPSRTPKKIIAMTRPLFASQTQYRRRIYRWRENNRVLIITFRKGEQGRTRELYDLTTDPYELHDLGPDNMSEVDTLDVHMATSNKKQVDSRDPLPSTVKSDIESLRGLGYVE